MKENTNIIKLLGIDLFSFDSWDEVDCDCSQFYEVKWELKELEQYNGCCMAFDTNGDVTIYDGASYAEIKSFNIGKIKEFREKLMNMYKD